MKRLCIISLATLAIAISACSDLHAQTKIELQSSDTIATILQKNVGQVIELRMKSGDKIAGKLEKVADKVVHLSQLTGAEFFDAVVETADVAAVVVRAKK